jgi:hypothetical protein
MATKPVPVASNKEQVLADFAQIFNQQKALASRITTKEEEAQRAQDRSLVEGASAYTAESIVKGLADLQLYFGTTVDTLTTRLQTESKRLDELKRAIAIEVAHTKALSDLKVAAAALAILNLEHKESLRLAEEGAAATRAALAAEQTHARISWSEAQRQFDLGQKEQAERQAAQRALAEQDGRYELERRRKLDADTQTEVRRVVERNLAEQDAQKAKAWAAREAVLAAAQAEYDTQKARVDAFDKELEAEVQKARSESISDTASDLRVKAELQQKEVEASRKVFALQIQQLEETIAKQAGQLSALEGQLQVALKQAQDLAIKAIENTGGKQGQAQP